MYFHLELHLTPVLILMSNVRVYIAQLFSFRQEEIDPSTESL